jgi:spore coat protein U-like protein
MRKYVLAPIAAGVLLAVAGGAQAAVKTANFNVSATVATNCLVSAANLGFGSFDGSTGLTGSSDVKVRCTNGTGFTVLLNAGSGSFATRLMKNGASSLEYNLYTTNALATVWGDGTASTATRTGTGTGLSAAGEQTLTVYGSLPNSAANQDAPAGSYLDTITVTVSY